MWHASRQPFHSCFQALSAYIFQTSGNRCYSSVCECRYGALIFQHHFACGMVVSYSPSSPGAKRLCASEKTDVAGILTNQLIERQHEIPQPVTIVTASLSCGGLQCSFSPSHTQTERHTVLMMFYQLAHSPSVIQ